MYQERNGTSYNVKTADSMVGLLEAIRLEHARVRFHWGDTTTGQDWGDVYDVCGTISRSTGPIKIPILIHNRRSLGGGAILDHCIVKITTTRGKQVLYQHPNYQESTQ